MKSIFRLIALIVLPGCIIPVEGQENFISGYAPVNGLEMYYEVHGPAGQDNANTPLIMIHGSFMSIPMNWSGFIPVLSADRKVIVMEMQGHGRTKDTGRALSFENMADDVSGLLKFLKVDSADVLGYSMGAGVAFQTAVRHPEQVRRLVILSGTYASDGWWPEVEASFETFNAEIFKGTLIEEEYIRLGNDPSQFSAYIDKIISIDTRAYDWFDQVSALQMPMFIALGDADGVRYEHALKLFLAKGGGKMGDINGLPDSRLAILPGTTHISMIAKTQYIIPMITDFLDSDLNEAPPSFD